MSFDLSVIVDHWPAFLKGAMTTLWISAISAVLGSALGLVIAIIQMSATPLVYVARGYIELIRGTPILIQLFIIYYGLPAYGVSLSATDAGLIALTLYMSAYAAEIIRSGIFSVPKGQIEAARSLGMGKLQTFRRITAPVMGPMILPSFTNEIVNLIKWSSVLSVITVHELTYAANDVIFTTFSPVEALAAVAVLYWVINDLFVHLSHALERHLKRHM
jgi:polar amino acid transport system permease protein